MHGRLLLVPALLVCLTAATAAAANSWKRYPVATAGFAISLPSTWVDVTSTAPAMLGQLAKEPSLKATAKAASEADAIKLIVADPAVQGRAYVDAGVQRVGTVGAAALLATTVKQLEQLSAGQGKVTTATADLPAGRASVIQFEFSTPSGPMRTLEYLLLRDQVEYAFAFSAPRAKWAVYAPVFAHSARTFAFLPGPDLTPVVLSGAQVGKGYRRTSFPGGGSVVGETTLDLCAGAYPSESLRTGRLQVEYTHAGPAVGVSNEVVTYLAGGAQQALKEVAAVARSCARQAVVRKAGSTTTTFRVTPLHDPKLLPGAVAVQIKLTATDGKRKVEQTGIAVYQVKGNTLSGVYAFVAKGTTFAQARRIGFHAAEQSAKKIGGLALTA
jgi:hypothetical protein